METTEYLVEGLTSETKILSGKQHLVTKEVEFQQYINPRFFSPMYIPCGGGVE
jgi:hypothetical protein